MILNVNRGINLYPAVFNNVVTAHALLQKQNVLVYEGKR